MTTTELDDFVLRDMVKLLSPSERRSLFDDLYKLPGVGLPNMKKARLAENVGQLIGLEKISVYRYLNPQKIPGLPLTLKVVKALLKPGSGGTDKAVEFLEQIAKRMKSDQEAFFEWKKQMLRHNFLRGSALSDYEMRRLFSTFARRNRFRRNL